MARQPELNHVVLTGVLADDPQQDQSRHGDPVTLLLIAFPAPDRKVEENWASACCEIEVPEDAAVKYSGELRVGAPVLIAGELSGGGGIVARIVEGGPPLGDDVDLPGWTHGP